ncbi:plasma-membrane choline transporter-domain-containing protein [Russula brevipes]|nr:plasma-membrane choline transporter-domain-containing protein [Russula brevipes]
MGGAAGAIVFTVGPILCGIPVSYSFSVFTLASRHGYCEAPQVRLRCSSGDFATPSFSERWKPSCSSDTVAGLVFFETPFSYIWTSSVIGNVSLTTLVGGPSGCWYYFGPREASLMPKHPTLRSFWRASTLNLGSIAFGSLIVTILEIVRLLLSFAKNNAEVEGNPVEACLACCAECLVGCIEGMVRYFNR